MPDYDGYQTKTYGAEVDGHTVELSFDKKLLVVNRAKLLVDGTEVDKAQVLYGEKTLSTQLADGTTIEVSIDSGAMGQLDRAQVRRQDGAWIDLEERAAAS